jgi:hypothetical protein
MPWRAAVRNQRDTAESGSPSMEDFLRLEVLMLSQPVGLLTGIMKLQMDDSQNGAQY